jgi:hypothetical protein
VLVPRSKAGKVRHVELTPEGLISFARYRQNVRSLFHCMGKPWAKALRHRRSSSDVVKPKLLVKITT